MKCDLIKLMSKIIMLLVVFYSLTNVFCSCSCTSAAYDWKKNIDATVTAQGDENVVTPIRSLAGTIVVVVRVICTGVAFIMLLVLGIKYMTSAPSDRASIIKHAWVYLVGALIMFASSGIIGLIAKFAGNLSK